MKCGRLLALMLDAISNTPATITLTSTLNGQSASPGQEVNYICTLTEAAVISWTFPPVSTDENCVQFTPTTPPDQRMLNSSDVPAINCADLNFWADLDFWAALTSVGTINMTNGLADLTSTLRFPATVALNEAVIQCSGLTRTSTEMANQTLIVEGMKFAMVYSCNLAIIRVSYTNLCWGGQ